MKVIYQELGTSANSSFTVKKYDQPKFTAPFHFHHGYELIWIMKGYGKLYAGNKILNFADNDMYFFGPGLAHCFYNEKAAEDPADNAKAMVVQFTEDFMGKDFFSKPELRRIRKLMNNASTGIKLTEPDDLLQKSFAGMLLMHDFTDLINLLQLLDNFSKQDEKKFLNISSDINQATFNADDYSKIELVLKYIMENFKTGVDSKDAAEMACLNNAAFCRYFNRRTKKTFSEFVNNVRVTHAIGLLQDNRLNIAEIGFECGYNNMSYFNRQFKIITGISPLEYRKMYILEQ